MQARRDKVLGFLLSPGAFWVIMFFLVPCFLVIIYSFLTRDSGGGVTWTPSLEAWQKLFERPEDRLINDFIFIFLRSGWFALVTTIICLLVGYPLAFLISRMPANLQGIAIFMILIPFWTNFLVRTYAWKFILNNNGLLNTFLQNLDMNRISVINTPTAVLIGLVYGSLPFMVLPLYASIEKLDFQLVEAAQDLGANYFRVFFRVILPLTIPGIAAGATLVFIPVTGQYIVPTILGGGRVAMLGNVLAQQFGSSLNWPFGSAIAVLFIVLLMVGVVSYVATNTSENESLI